MNMASHLIREDCFVLCCSFTIKMCKRRVNARHGRGWIYGQKQDLVAPRRMIFARVQMISNLSCLNYIHSSGQGLYFFG